MMTLFQRNFFVPMTFLNQQMVIPTCGCITSRFQCYLLMYFKNNDKNKTSCFLIRLCSISLQISFFLFFFFFHSFFNFHFFFFFFFNISSALTFLFREKLQFKEMFSYLIRKMISEAFSVKSDENCFNIVSCVCVFHLEESGLSLQTLTRPLQELKSFKLFFVHYDLF